MEIAALPDDEKQRLAALFSYQILDTETEKEFDDLVLLAADICDTPIALISLIDPHRQWFKASVGLGAKETSRDIAFCSHAILQKDILEVEDTFLDRRFYDNPLVLDDPNIRFYAGAQLVTPDGYTLGTLCTISDQPKKLSDRQRKALTTMASEVVARMELHKQIKQMQLLQQELQDTNQLLGAINQIQNLSIENATKPKMFSQMLKNLLELTMCQQGFIAEVKPPQELKDKARIDHIRLPFLKMYARPDDLWDETRQTFLANSHSEELTLIQFNSLIPEALEKRHFVASHDDSSANFITSEGHQIENYFAVLPLIVSEQIVALVGVANRKGGLNVQLFEKIQPFLSTFAQLIKIDVDSISTCR